MHTQYELTLFLFHRDLRIQDNTAMIQAMKQSKKILPLFIFDTKQIEQNTYKSENALQFMCESLQDLDIALKKIGGKLYYAKGNTLSVIKRIALYHNVQAIFSNADYTPFATQRDTELSNFCKAKKIAWHQYQDALLHPVGSILKSDNTPYTMFTPFFKKAQQHPIPLPQTYTYNNFLTQSIIETSTHILISIPNNPTIAFHGGRTHGKKILQSMSKYVNYQVQRNILHQNATTHLSAHHKFGTVSIRETYKKITEVFGTQHSLITELHWRDFFTHIAHYFPHIFHGPFKKRYEKFPWEHDTNVFKTWSEGNTGVPIIDAGIHELRKTGFMHNRVRMITASFLTKDLRINWRWGEKFFAEHLIDYDPSVNNGNWQWVASTGCDAQPYIRIFNPWIQQKTHDPECIYIKKWIPELKKYNKHVIHNLYKQTVPEYTSPIVNHSDEVKKTKKLHENILKTY